MPLTGGHAVGPEAPTRRRITKREHRSRVTSAGGAGALCSAHDRLHRAQGWHVTEHQRGSVLVVDDEPTIADVVSRYLERAGYRTQVAHDGRSALAAAQESRPDLVVLDLMLPGVDG